MNEISPRLDVGDVLCTRCGTVLIAPGIELDWSRREVRQATVDGGETVLRMGPLQADIMAVLWRESPRWCRPDRIVARVYGHTGACTNPAASVRQTIHMLRRRLAAAGIALKIDSSNVGRAFRGYRLVTPGLEQERKAA